MSDLPEIHLQPECCADPEMGRVWCENTDPEPCEDGVPWTKYLRADLKVPFLFMPQDEKNEIIEAVHREVKQLIGSKTEITQGEIGVILGISYAKLMDKALAE